MIVKRELLILLSLLLLMGPVTAYYASSTSFGPSDPSTVWIIADTGQNNVINLVAANTTVGPTFGPVTNAQVTFTLDNPALGTISPLSTQTDNLGHANCTFTVNSTHPTSGTVTITADLISTDEATGATYHTVRTWVQHIDHNVPYNAVITYPNLVGVESVVPVQISIFDRWSNPVDDKRPGPAHNLTLHVNGPSPPNNCGFTDYGLIHDNNLNLDPHGNVSINITPATIPGWHYIIMDPMGSIPTQERLFDTVANGVPFSMNQTFSPDGSPYATVLADGTSKFNFYYTLKDKYGNPTQNQGILVNISDGSNLVLTSIENGEAWSHFGPKSFTGLYTINATAAGNTSLQFSKVVRFYNTTPQYVEVSANPQTIPSRDALPSIYSNISAKVTDIMGNGVGGEWVTFTLHDLTDSPVSANETMNASFSSISKQWTATVMTDPYGYATVSLYPPKYATINTPGYNDQVTGTGTVTSNWDGNQRDVKITWKNYPYLSAAVAVNPQQVKVGDTVNVSVKLNGDGWALVPTPADVVIITDLAGGIGGPSRMADTKTAEVNFVQDTTPYTYISLVSFGRSPTTAGQGGIYASADTISLWNQQQIDHLPHFQSWSGAPLDKDMVDPATWNHVDINTHCNGLSNCLNASVPGLYYQNPSPDAKIEMDFTNNHNNLITLINGYSDYGGTDYAAGINAAINEFNAHGTPGHSKTIIIMGDGINMMAPIAPGSLESYWPSDWYPRPYLGYMDESDVGRAAAIDAANRAKAQGITIYGAGFPTTVNAGPSPGIYIDHDLMAQMSSPGCYNQSSSTATLSQVFQAILGKVQVDASVNTITSLDFGNLIVNNNPATTGHYFDYVSNTTSLPGSTMLDKYNTTPDGSIDQHLIAGYDPDNPLISLTSIVAPFSSTGPIIINQSDYYQNNNQHLKFGIGTIKVNESWETNFQLKVLQEGNIQIFGPASQICFTDGSAGNSCEGLGNLSFSSSMNAGNYGLSQTTISIVGLTRTDGGTGTSTIPVSWTTNYNGNSTITEEVNYIHDNDPPIKFDVKTIDPTAGPIPVMMSTLDMEKLPSGGYKIQIHAYTNDASATTECGPYSYTTAGRSFIKLE